MKMVIPTIPVRELVPSLYCVDAEDGHKLFLLISKSFRDEKNAVILSFEGIELITSAFLNTAIGQLYRDFSEETIKTGLKVEGMSQEDLGLLKRVVDTAKIYYKDPDRMERSLREVLGE
ncbi:STAS-like domain-containing protein [Leptospira mtsangambouensis]|uniref:STAS-like domain-containing protein n=1 Tax=Leptospira mtsangambouensis TaxID=2484912 RepID=UPI001EEBA7E3|nr:STAS-like domain-containing protein [Leptospira mtsangambouensis]MCG6141667.1 STAS-like domain-containing protein [Leptospira mtsangambouensis]